MSALEKEELRRTLGELGHCLGVLGGPSRRESESTILGITATSDADLKYNVMS